MIANLGTASYPGSHGANACFGYEGGSDQIAYSNFTVTNNLLMSKGYYSMFSAEGTVTFNNLNFSRNTYVIKPFYVSTPQSYVFFSRSAGTHNLYDCTFADNTIYVPQASSAVGPFYAGIVFAENSSITMVNNILENNSISVAQGVGMTPTFGQILICGSSSKLGIANSVFSHYDRDTYDFAFTGTSVNNAKIVNSIFQRGGGELTYQPFLLPAGNTNTLMKSSIAGVGEEDLRVEGTLIWEGSDAYPVALAEEMAVGFANPVLRPQAATPTLRDSYDVALDTLTTYNFSDGETSMTYDPTFSYSNVTAWVALPPSASSKKGVLGRITDAIGTSRTTGALTRGAVQTLASEGRFGLTVLKEPWMAGSVSPALSVAANESGVTPALTATTNFGGTEVTWYAADGVTVLATGVTLPAQTLSSNTAVIAKFATPIVTVTFNLGEAGTFGNGYAVTQITASAGAALDVPAYVLGDYLPEGWSPEVPTSMPAENTTYTLHYVSKAVRVFHVVPAGKMPTGSDGSGTNWANATTNIAAAIRDAGRYRGELWFKAGTYILDAALPIAANVGLYGGFAGTETARDQADAEANRVIFTGDFAKENYWRANGDTGSNEGLVLAFDAEGNATYNPPNPEAGEYWQAVSLTNDTDYAFEAYNTGTNFVAGGITFASFDQVLSQITSQTGMTFTNCRVVGITGTAFTMSAAKGAFADCVFEGDAQAVSCTDSTATGMRFDNCVFRKNYTTTCLLYLSSGSWNFSDCEFIDNIITGTGASKGLFVSYAGITLNECNVTRNTCEYVVYLDAGNSYGRISDSKFEENNFKYLFRMRDGGWNMMRNCYVANNNTSGAKDGRMLEQTSSAYVLIQNTTFYANAGKVAFFNVRGQQFANCMFLDNVFLGASKEEIVSSVITYGVNVVNSIFQNQTSGYCPIKKSATGDLPLRLAGVAMSGAPDPMSTGGWTYNLATGVQEWISRRVQTKGNVAGLRISAFSPYANKGVKTYA